MDDKAQPAAHDNSEAAHVQSNVDILTPETTGTVGV